MPRITAWRFVLLAALLFETIAWSAQDEPIRLERVFEAAAVDQGLAREALTDLATNWRGVDAAMLCYRSSCPPRPGIPCSVPQ